MSLSCVALCYAEFSDVHLLLAICYYDGFYNEFLIQQKEYALLASSNGKIYCPSGRKSTFHDDFAFITGMIFGNVLLILLFFVYDLPSSAWHNAVCHCLMKRILLYFLLRSHIL